MATISTSQVPQHMPEEPEPLQHRSHPEELLVQDTQVASSNNHWPQDLYSDALLDAALSLPPVLLSMMTAEQIEHRLQLVRDIADAAMRSQGR